MILSFTFALPLLAAILCLALNRVADTRWLSFGASAVMLLVAALLLVAQSRGDLVLPERPWLQLEDQTLQLALGYDAASLPLGLLVALVGAVALLALALALPARLRAYGGLVAALTLLLDATLIGLATRETLLLPLAWAALPLLAFVSLRASGGQIGVETLPLGLLSNLFGAILLLGATLSARFAGVGFAAPDVALAGVLLAGALALGLPPFHRTLRDGAEAPANVAAPLLALGLPLLGGATLMRFTAQTQMSDTWRVAFQLLGLLALVVCAAGALNERRLRRLVSWQMSAQWGVLLVVLGQSQAALATIAPALLVNIVLVTTVALLAVGFIERRSGTDDLNEIHLSGAMALPGLALLFAAASSVGFPGTWGFWPMHWLLGELRDARPLLIAPLLTGMTLLAFAWIAPAVAFWRAGNTRETSPGGLLEALNPLVAALPLVVFGIVPQFAWRTWGASARLALLPLAPTDLSDPVLPTLAASLAGAFALLALAGIPLLRRRTVRRTLPDPELPASGVMTPDGLGESARGLAWFGAPSGLFAWAWQGLVAASRGISWALSFLEQRYYMAGLLIAVVAVLLLLMRG